MSIWEFIWNAVWRQAGAVARVIQTVSVTIPFVLTIGIAAFGGSWSREVWPWSVWGTLTVGLLICAIVFGVARRAYGLEKQLKGREDRLAALRELGSLWKKGIAIRNGAASKRMIFAADQKKIEDLLTLIYNAVERISPSSVITIETLGVYNRAEIPESCRKEHYNGDKTLENFSEKLARVQKLIDRCENM